MKLTESTLKMARISGLDYAESTDYMTNALRSFKMQMQDAEKIVNVYSAVAASSATNVEELAEAMSKTASSAEAVGSSFENTTAMMAVMIEATRQAPENIGSAMKSIISRYGELKVNPSTLVDSQGEALSLNKVDTALQSVGIAIHNANGEFREFDDVIFDLAQKWDTIDVNTQRYIATVMAGNRQQSRFLALVSSYERLKEEVEIAANSQNAAQLQYLKTLDSIEAKQQQLKTSMQSLYTSTGVQAFYGTLIDLGNSVIKTFTDMPTVFNLPIPALLKLGTTFYNIASVVTQAFVMMKTRMNLQMQASESQITAIQAQQALKRGEINQDECDRRVRAAQEAAEKLKIAERGITGATAQESAKRNKLSNLFKSKTGGMIASAAGAAMTLGAAAMGTGTDAERYSKAGLTGLGGALQGIGTGLMLGGPAGAVMGVLTALPSAIDAIGIAIETTEQKIEKYDKAIQDASNNKLVSQNEFKTLTDYKEKWQQLEKIHNNNNETQEQWIKLNNEIANKYPELISNIDSQGNLIVDLTKNYDILAEAKRSAYASDIVKAGQEELKAISDPDWLLKQMNISQQQLRKTYNTGESNFLAHQQFGIMQDAFSIGAFVHTLGYGQENFQELAKITQQLFKNYEETIKDNEQLWGQYEAAQKPQASAEDWTFNQLLTKYIPRISNLLGDTVENLYAAYAKEGINSQASEFVTNIAEYRDNFIHNVITQSISQLRKTYDAIQDKDKEVSGLAGIYMNKQLMDSYQQYAESQHKNGNTNEDQIWKTWSSGEGLPEQFNGMYASYQNAFQTITNNSGKAFKELDQYYQNIGNITQIQYNELKNKYNNISEASAAWGTFKEEYDKVQKQANNALLQAGINVFTNFSANIKNRIVALKSKDNFDVQAFVTKFSGQNEETIEQLLGFIESGTTDTISGIEDIIKQYAQTKGIDLSKESDTFINLMRELEDTVRINFNTEYQTLAESYTSHLKEFDKALKNATSGMGYEDAVALANQLGVTLGEFQQREGKFYLDNLNIIKNKLMPGQDGLKQVLQNRAKIVEQAFDENGNIISVWLDQQTEQALSAWPSELRQVYSAIQGFKNSGKEKTLKGWKEYIAQLQSNFTELDKATQYMIQSNWLATGNLEKFLSEIKDGNAQGINKSQLYTKALKGQLTGELAQFSQQIIELYQKNTTAVYDAVTKLINGQSVSESIVVTDTNRELIEKILDKKLDDSQIGQVVQIPAEKAAENFNKTLYSLLGDQSYNWKARIEAAGKLWEAAFSTSNFRLDALKSAINSSFQDLDFATWGALPESIKLLADYNKTTGKFFVDLNQAAQVINAQSLIDEGFTKKEANELIATLRKNTREKDIKTIASELVKNRESLTEENISTIATALNQTYDEIIATLQLQRNEDGTYRMNMNSILQLMEQKRGQLDTVLAQMIAEEIDNIIGNVSDIASNQNKGTTKFADMQKAVTRAQEAGFKVESVNDLYEWDEAVRGYVLNTQGLFIQLAQARMQLESLGQNQQEARELLQHQIDSIGRELANNVDITKYISSPNNWNENTEVFKNFKKSLEDLNKYFEATGKAVYNIDVVMSSLRQGGVGAVAIAQQIARLQGIDLSDDDITKIFRAKVDWILEVNDQLTATAGEIISQDAGNFLNAMKSGAQLKKLENGSYLVIKSAENLAEAYLNIYQELVKSGHSTVEQLNGVAAQYFNAQAKTSKLDTLHDIAGAAELTYDELADLFTQAGWTMSTNIFNELEGVIENLDNGKARIVNFSAFAQALGIDQSTDEYFKALQEFNDNLIDSWNDTRNHVAEQIEDLSKAGPSDLVNVTQLQRTLGDKFTEIIGKYGGLVSDGILQVTTDTKMPALIKEITTESAKAGNLLKDEVKNLIDVVNQLYKDMADAIVDGMKGGLSNNDANYLKTQAKSNFGLDINFTQSYQGLKLSTNQAIKLYNALKQVDTVSAHLVFEELTEQLTKTGQACESMSRAMAEIARLEEQVAKSTGKARQEAEQQLSVYKEIANLQLNNPDAYDFMGNSLPDYLKGPENYWNSLGKAFKALNEAAKPPKEGAIGQGNYLDPTDFYNMVNEFNNIAKLSGTSIKFMGQELNGDMASAAKLIEQGMSYLTNIDGEGVKIDLAKFGVNFTDGAEGMTKGVHQGIKAMAKSQIEMLDGMIQLLETVVAMEGLKDVASGTGDENVIDLTDIFPKIEVNPEDFTVNEKIISWIDKLFASDNQDLQKALTNVKFGTKTLKQILTDLKNGSIQSEEEAKQAQQALNALYQMYLSGDYSLQNLIGSIKQVLSSSGYEGQIQVGDTKLYISQGFILEHGKQGWEVPGVGTFTDKNKAIKAYQLHEETGRSDFTETKTGELQTQIKLSDTTITATTSVDGIKYLVQGPEGKSMQTSSWNQAIHTAYSQFYARELAAGKPIDEIISENEWLVQNNLTLKSDIVVTNEQQVKQATHKQIQELAEALVSNDKEKIQVAAKNVGIEIDISGDITQADFQKLAATAGIQTKTLALSLATEIIGDNAAGIKKILQEQPLTGSVQLTGELTGLTETQGNITYDKQVAVTLSNIKAMATADNINWDGITTLINSVPEDKRPTVEAQAKQYIIKALEGNPEYQGFPTLLTGLQGLPIPALQATATVMSILWGGGANVTNATGLTEEEINTLAATLDLPDTMLEVLATLVQIVNGGVVAEESTELVNALKVLFPDGKYTTDDIKAITLVATAAAVMLNGKGITATGKFDKEYKVADKVSQVTADIVKLIVSTNANTTTEKGTTFNADNWQGTIDKINAVAALLEIGLQTNADINVDGTNIPSTVATTKTIENLRAVAEVLNVVFKQNPTGKDIDVSKVDKAIADLEQQGIIKASDIQTIKSIVNGILFEPKDNNMKPQGLDNLIPKDSDGKYNAGPLTVKYETDVEFDIDAEQKAFKDLRDTIYKTLDSNKLVTTQAVGNYFSSNITAQQQEYLDQLLTRVSNGKNLSIIDENILNKWRNSLQYAKNANQQLEDFYNQINQIQSQNDINISEQEQQVRILSQAFKDLDTTKLQECATAMGELAENAQKVKDVPWAELVSGVNNINNIETPDEDLATASTIMRTVQASLSIVAATGDTVAAEIISLDPIQRTVQLLADAKSIQEALTNLQTKITIGTGETNTTTAVGESISTTSDQVDTSGINALSTALQKAINEAENIFNELTIMLSTLRSDSDTSANTISNLSETINNIPRGRDQRVGALASAMDRIPAVSGRISALNSQLNALANKVINITLQVSLAGEPGQVKGTVDGKTLKVGRPVALSFVKGNIAAAKGKTLVGELGPELVVSNGRYYIVGQTGAQMVSLPDDAIVFNHIQTQNLLKKQRGGGRGKPITNERNAVSFAKGTGPAMASASAALAALKQIRAMWQSMLTASMKDLGSLAGQEVGKAKSKTTSGNGGQDNSPEQIHAIIEEIERWYNLLRQINRLQQDITYQQSLQAEIESDRVANGRALYQSYKQEIEFLDQQIKKNQQLADLQKSWYERKRNQLKQSDYGLIFTYNENGQLQYQNGSNRGLDILQKLTQRDIYGQTSGVATNAATQINYLRSIGFNTEKLKYNDDGTIIDASSDDYKDNHDKIYEDMMENFWDNLDGWKEELDGIYDSYRDQLNNVLTNETKRNQLLQKIIDNQLSVEQDVLKAIESRQQKLIDKLQDERDALEKSNKDFIDGLTDQLNQQKQMYQNAENEKQLIKLRRQAAILQRSGGSITQINSLQEQIAAKEQEQYFNMQQQQITAIQKASDLQIKRLDAQIELMTETLKYSQQHGLLWEEVYQLMNAAPEQIRHFIIENTPDFQSASALDVAEKIRDIDLRINEWIGYRDDQDAPSMSGDGYYDWNSYSAARTEIYGNRASGELMNQAKAEFDRVLNQTDDINAAGAMADQILAKFFVNNAPIKSETTIGEKIQEINNNNNNNNNNNDKNNDKTNSTSYFDAIDYHSYNKIKEEEAQRYVNSQIKKAQNTDSVSSKIEWTFTDSGIRSAGEIASEMEKISAMIPNTPEGSPQRKILQDQYKRNEAALGPYIIKHLKPKYKFISGGLVNYTGLAQVDGTPSHPEAFLNAEQTQLLRNYLFSPSNSLLAFTKELVQQLHEIDYNSSTFSQEENSGITIENVDVNVNVKQIANDYDVRTIGNTVMDEMLKIARKSGTRGLSRR